jgi:hypothetical protein
MQLAATGMPAQMYVVGSNVVSAARYGQGLGLDFAVAPSVWLASFEAAHDGPPDVVVCISPPVVGKQVLVLVQAATVDVNGLVDDTGAVPGVVDSDVGTTAFTNRTGCATFPRLRFSAGSTRSHVLAFVSDALMLRCGPIAAVNPRLPNFQPMAFISGTGVYAAQLYVVWLRASCSSVMLE